MTAGIESAREQNIIRGGTEKKSVGAFVYMLRCADASYYVGVATGEDLTKRVTEHQIGAYPGSYTYSRRPVELVWSDHFDRITDAIAAERQIKGWSRA